MRRPCQWLRKELSAGAANCRGFDSKFSMAGADGLRSVTVGYGPEILGFFQDAFQRDSDR